MKIHRFILLRNWLKSMIFRNQRYRRDQKSIEEGCVVELASCPAFCPVKVDWYELQVHTHNSKNENTPFLGDLKEHFKSLKASYKAGLLRSWVYLSDFRGAFLTIKIV